uniref:Uncharacterized protein n=1 Tax=Arundo donax TaxID=35708 RepID=A0A0A9GYH1_ARUDO
MSAWLAGELIAELKVCTTVARRNRLLTIPMKRQYNYRLWKNCWSTLLGVKKSLLCQLHYTI